MKKQEAVNTFSDGLIMDLNPLSMPNTALTNCLNGTLLTYNGNENMLQNDMGNARVETAMLPTGYIPLGSTSLGGIIYIVSYNPLDGKYQIGSFPSPERNLSKDELEKNSDSSINLDRFCSNGWKITTEKDEKGNDKIDENGKPITKAPYSTETVITNYYQKVNLLKKNIYPGDKYKIFSGEIHDKQNYISAWHEGNNKNNKYNSNYFPKYLKLDVISTQSNGKTINLTNDSVWTAPSGHPPYYIHDGTITKDSDGKLDLDEYRGLVGSNYDTYVSKLSGMLGIVAKLEVPTSFSVGYDVIIKENQTLAGKKFNKVYNLYFYLNWANDNEVNDYKNRINPKFLYTRIQKIGNREKSVHKAEIKLRQANGTIVVDEGSDALLDRDYATIEMPEYYNDDNKFDIVNYLEHLQNNFNPTILRKNDGTDFYYVIKGPIIGQTYNKETNEDEFYLVGEIQDERSQSVKYYIKDEIAVNNNILDLTVTPVMPFGQLQFLEKQLSIDLSKINSGALDILNYQYYVDDDTVNMDFNIESYLTLGDHIKEVQLEFYTIKDVLSISGWTTEEKIPNPWSKEGELSAIVSRCILQETYEKEDTSGKILNKNPAGGHKLTPIVIPENPITNIANGQCNIKFNRKQPNTKIQGINTKWFEENKIYVVKINIKTKNSEDNERVFYRLFFNSPIFNTAYNSGEDFKDLYLIDSKTSYGLTPTFKFTDSPNNTVNPVTVNNLNKFEKNKPQQNVKITHNYLVKRTIRSGYELASELGKEVKLSFRDDLSNKGTVEASTPLDILSSERIKLDNRTSTQPTINGNVFTYSDTFSLYIPYTAIYDSTVSLKEYELKPLKDAVQNIHAVIQHYTEHEGDGHLELFVKSASSSEKYIIEDRREDYYCPDGSKNMTFTMDDMALALVNDIEEYDYCTLCFGVQWMRDDNCGYGYKTLSGPVKSQNFIKFPRKPGPAYMKINCIKGIDGSIRFIFDRNKGGLSITQANAGDKLDQRFTKYSEVSNVAKDSVLLNSSKAPSNSLLYKKYESNGTVKTLYTISNLIDYPENPSVKTTYTFNIMNNSIILSIDQKRMNIVYEDEHKLKSITSYDGIACNLKQRDGDNLSVNINLDLSTNIYNKDFVNQMLELNSSWSGWDGENPITQKDLSRVYGQNGQVVTALTINNKGMAVLSDDYLNNSCFPTRWYFAWEDTDPRNGDNNAPSNYVTSSEQQIMASAQYYKLQYLYSCEPFQAVPKSSLETGFISGGNNSGFKDSEETGATGGNNSGLISGDNNSGATGDNNSGLKDFEEIEAT